MEHFPDTPPLGLPLVGRLETLVEKAISAYPNEAAYAPIADQTRHVIRMIDAIADARK